MIVATQLRRERIGVVPSPRARGGHLVAHTVHEPPVADVDLGAAFGVRALEHRFNGRALIRTGQLCRLARGNEKRLPIGMLGGQLFRRRGMVGTVDVERRVLRRQLGHVWILGGSERVVVACIGNFLWREWMADTMGESSPSAFPTKQEAANAE